MGTDPGIQTHTVDDLLGAQTLGLRVGVQLIEIGHPQGKIGVGEQLHSLCLGEAHVEGVDVLLDGALLQQGSKDVCSLLTLSVAADDDPGGVEVVVQGLGLPQEFGAEDDVGGVVLFPDMSGVTHGDGGLDDHDGIGIDLQHQLDHGFHRGAVEEVLLAVVVGGCGDDDEVRIPVGALTVQRGGQIQLLLSQILLDVLVLNGGLAVVDERDLLGDDVHGGDMVVLGQQGGNGQAHIAGACHRDVIAPDAPGRRGERLLLHEDLGHVEVQGLAQGLQLGDGGGVFTLLDLADGGPVQTGHSGQLGLTELHAVPAAGYDIGKTLHGKYVHIKNLTMLSILAV